MVSSKPSIIELPEVDSGQTSGDFGWIVTVFNNEVNTWDEVMNVLMTATGCDYDEAYMETWEIDNLGKSVVHHGGEKECRDAAGIIAGIGIKVEVSQE